MIASHVIAARHEYRCKKGRVAACQSQPESALLGTGQGDMGFFWCGPRLLLVSFSLPIDESKGVCAMVGGWLHMTAHVDARCRRHSHA
jgi:hypothetical protein